jgi:hypothetical protein
MTWAGIEPRTSRIPSEHANHYTIRWWNVAAKQGLYAESCVDDGMRLVFHGEPHRWHVCVGRVTWSWSNNQISIGGPVVREFANHARGLGFNPRDKRPLISNNYFQFIKIEWELIRDRTSNLSHSKRVRQPLYHDLMICSSIAGFICRIMSRRWLASRLSRRAA